VAKNEMIGRRKAAENETVGEMRMPMTEGRARIDRFAEMAVCRRA
jgi:hypothetical protein